MAEVIEPNVPSTPEINLTPPRPLSHTIFPLQQDHISRLYKHTGGGNPLHLRRFSPFKGNVSDLIKELIMDIVSLAQDYELSYPKLHNCVHYYHSKRAVDGIIEDLTFSLSSLILKIAHIIDGIGALDGHDQKRANGNSITSKSESENVSALAANSITTMLTLQGGLGRNLVNLNSVKKNVDSGVFDPSEVMSDKSVEEVVSAWAEVKKKAQECIIWLAS